MSKRTLQRFLSDNDDALVFPFSASACVVDLGDQKTSISCVEDGISHPETRIHLDYGGSDIARVGRKSCPYLAQKQSLAMLFVLQVFYHLLVEDLGAACLKSEDPSFSGARSRLLTRLKEDACHLDLDRCGLEQRTIRTGCPGEGEEEEEIDVFFADEALIAPHALFEPGIFDVAAGKKKVRCVGTFSVCTALDSM